MDMKKKFALTSNGVFYYKLANTANSNSGVIRFL